MAKGENKHFFNVFLMRVAGFILFLALIFSIKIFANYFQNPILFRVVDFFDDNMVSIIIMSFILLVGELFYVLPFPFNLPSPVISAFGSLFVINFIFNVFALADEITETKIFATFEFIKYVLYIVVFLGVIVFGYIGIFFKLFGIGRWGKEKRQESNAGGEKK